MNGIIVRIVEFSRSHAVIVVLLLLAASIAAGVYSASHISIDTDLDKLISQNEPWRQREAEMDAAFPQNADLLVIVVDGATTGQTEDAAIALTNKLRAESTLFRNVRMPDGYDYFRHDGLMLLPKEAVQGFADQIIQAQPFLGTLAADPSLRGIFAAVGLLSQGIAHDAVDPSQIDPALNGIADTTEAALNGQYKPLAWRAFLSGVPAERRELRRLVLAQPALSFNSLAPGEGAIQEIRDAATSLGLTPDRGIRVRITGPVALGDDQLQSLSEGAGFSAALSIGLLCLWLFLALSSTRVFCAIIITLMVGLIGVTFFAVTVVGALNPISVAFAVLFVGIAVDFSIQFSVRYRDERHHSGDLAEALRRTAAGIGRPMAVAAAATAVGFFSFVPTAYTGVRDLGLIAGVGMLIALALNLTLLPALITLMRPKGELRAVGFAWAAPVDRFLIRRRVAVILAAGLLVLGSILAVSHLRFDFNPLNLQSAKAESVSTLFDLMGDPNTTPYVIEILTPSPEAAGALADKISAVPEVQQALTVNDFVPDDQDEKIAILSDAKTLLGPTLNPAEIRPPPTDAETLAAFAQASRQMAAIAGKDAAAARLGKLLDAAVARGPSVLPALQANLADGIGARLDDLRFALDPIKVTAETLPPDIKADWVTADGRAVVRVFPSGPVRDNKVLRRFVNAVRAIAPDATGSPVTVQESARTVIRAFVTAGIIAIVTIALLLLAVLRRPLDVARVLVPLLLAGLMTLATAVLLGLSLNYANIIALPLLLGIGVSFDIYFVMRWRSGLRDLLQSSTARAILFSALTTGTAFGSLALSKHPGTAEMGKLLSIALAYTLFCTFIILPALLGPVPVKRDGAD